MENNDKDQDLDYLLYLASADNAETENFAAALKLFGYEIKIFHQADDLARAITDQEPHALILDCDTDEGRLADMAMQARFADSNAFFPVIMLSTEDTFDKRLTAVRAGVEGYFIKPVDIATLADRIDDKISRREIRAYRILAIDDDVLLSEFYQAVLNLAAMHVKVLNDPSHVLDVLASFQPDLILLDMHMPGCSGAEVAKLLRLNNMYINIPIIFLSGDDDIQRQVSAIETGADNFLTKPIDPENLISIISSRVERYRALGSAHQQARS